MVVPGGPRRRLTPSKPGSIQQQAVEQMDGMMAHGLDKAVLARFTNPAAAIGAWITLASWTSPELRGGASYGYGHRADLVRLCTCRGRRAGEHRRPGRALDQLRR